ncbi:type II toxin-antitoxin system VapC family toxin [Acidovorax sp. BoFeN1]|nr:type II toxin-antitoxin system VapC family toxin [Acidovorax sp. BoFeN1]
MRPVPHAGVVRWVEALDQTAGFAVSAVSVDEILFGLTHKPRPRALELFNGLAARITVLDVTEAVARRAGEMRGLLAARGQVRSQADMFIAATAQVHALTLVTRNVCDFDGCGIAVLNPFSA